MKERLRDQKKKNHEEFRQELVQDVGTKMEKWENSILTKLRDQTQLMLDSGKYIKSVEGRVSEVSKDLEAIRKKTIAEVQAMKEGRGWRFIATCFISALLGGFTALTVYCLIF